MATPRIVVLDGITLNPGDLSWSALAALGTVKVYERTPEPEVVTRAAGAQMVLTNKAVLSATTIEKLERLQYIGVTATGYNVVDVAAARKRGIVVTNVPVYSTDSVVQMVFAHLLHCTQHVAHHAAEVASGRWSRSADWCFWDHPLVELRDQTLGIVGFGRIGQAVAGVAEAFGMRVIVHTRSPGADRPALEFGDLATLLKRSDVVSLHCPLTPETEGMINAERLGLMKPTAILINTGRGPLLDDAAVAAVLNESRLAYAGLDVLTHEPPSPDNPLLTAKNCHITPHIAWATRAARARLMQLAVENVEAFLNGSPQNVVG